MALPKPRRLGNDYKCTVVESSMNLDFDLIIPDKDKRPGVAKSLVESQLERRCMMALYDDMEFADAVKEVEDLIAILHERIAQSRDDDDDEDDIARDEYLADALQVVLDAAVKSVKGGES